jgi:hypothetical protein
MIEKNPVQWRIPFPEAGEGALIVLSKDVLRKLSTEPGWLLQTMRDIVEFRMDVIDNVLKASLVGAEFDPEYWGLPVQTVAFKLLDSLSWSAFGEPYMKDDAA